MSVHKRVMYEGNSGDLLRRHYKLSDLVEFVDSIVKDNEGIDPADVLLQFDGGLRAEVRVPLTQDTT